MMHRLKSKDALAPGGTDVSGSRAHTGEQRTRLLRPSDGVLMEDKRWVVHNGELRAVRVGDWIRRSRYGGGRERDVDATERCLTLTRSSRGTPSCFCQVAGLMHKFDRTGEMPTGAPSWRIVGEGIQ